MNRFFTIILALLLQSTLLLAQDCVPIAFPTEVDNQVFMLSSLNEKGAELFLSSNSNFKKGKLDAVKAEAGSQAHTYKATNHLLWRIEREGESQVRLFSIDRAAYLTHTSTKLGLAFSKGKTALSLWDVENHDGTMALIHPNDHSRTLNLTSLFDNQMYTDKGVFDNYAKTYNANYGFRLYLYGPQSAQGSCTMPAQGVNVCIGTDGLLFTGATNAAISTDDYLLSNGKIASFEALATFTVETKSQDSFYLKHAQRYLSYDLTETSVPTTWTIDHGMICTTESSPRYLCFSHDRFVLTSYDDAIGNVAFHEVASAPTFSVNAQGVCTLSGGWSAKALAAISFDGIKCLDITALALPIHTIGFEQQVANVPIFIHSAAQKYVPTAWHFVVACSQSNKLLDNSLTLSDEHPFFTDRDIEVAANQVVYERHTAPSSVAKWQTISLPFEANVVAGAAYVLESMDNNVLTFAPVAQLESSRGYLICPDSTGTISLSSIATSLTASTDIDHPFKATFQSFAVQPAASTTYLLHPTLQVFKKAYAGSTIRPFRAYISTTTDHAPALSIRWKR